MFELVATPIDPADLRDRLAAPDTGALAVFEGRVRNHHLGRPVTQLEYEAFDDLARLEGEAIVAEAERLHPSARVVCVHRTGTLPVGEIAVWIGVASPHRQAAFAACRHVIEELKVRLPIWKKEHHPDGRAEWINCVAEAHASAVADAPGASAGNAPAPVAETRSVATGGYHARQVALPEIGRTGQAKLAAARALVVGVGGLGCPAALYLAGAGVGRLTLVDGGRVELSNLHRQVLFTAAEIGAPKTLAAAACLRRHNPAVEIVTHEGELTAANARTLVAGQGVVLDCSDNFATRFLLHDACRSLGVPLVQAAADRFEGSLDVFHGRAGGCIHCLWLGRTAADLETAGNCAGGPVFGPAVGVLGVMQAAEAIKLLLGLEGDAPRQTRLVNLLDGTQITIARTARPECPVCARLDQLSPAADAPPPDGTPWLLEAADVAALGPTVRLVFLTEPGMSSDPPAKALVVPAGDLGRLRELALRGPLVLTCRHGLRSAALARLLRAQGLSGIHALAGGATAATTLRHG